MRPFPVPGLNMNLMRATLLSLSLALLAGCGTDSAPPSPQTPASVTQPAAPDKVQDPVADTDRAEVEAVKKILAIKHPDLAALPHRVSKVPNTNLFEVVTGTSVIYTDKTGDWFVSGVMYFGAGQAPAALLEDQAAQDSIIPYTRRPAMQMILASLSDPSKAPATEDLEGVQSLLSGDMTGRQMFDALPMQAGFSTRLGTGTQKLVVFEDPDCPVCQAFHKNLAAAKAAGTADDLDVELVTFPYVLSDRHPNALARSRAIACSPDPSAAWSKWMLAASQTAPGPNGVKDLDALWSVWAPINANNGQDCARAALVDAWQAAGRQMQFMATPTFLFADGTTFEGLLSVSDLREMLAVAAKNRAAQPDNAGGPLARGTEVSSQAAAALRELTEAALGETEIVEQEPQKPTPPPSP